MLKKYPSSALIAILVIACIECPFLIMSENLTGLPTLQPTADDAVIVAKRALYNRATGRVAIIGDSSSFHGLNPAEMSNAKNIEFMNFGTLASLTLAGYSSMGVELLNLKSPPKAILLTVLPQTLTIDKERARSMEQVGRFLIAYDIALKDVYDTSSKEYLDWIVEKHRFNIFPPEFGGSFHNFNETLRQNNGFMEEKKRQINTSATIQSLNPSSLSLASINFLVAAAKHKEVPVFIVLSPKPRSTISGSYLADSTKLLSELRKKYPTLIVPQSVAPVWGDAYFGTESHLNLDGAKRFSHLVVEKIAAEL